MTEKGLSNTGDDWREQIAHLQAELDELLPQLVEAETELAEKHAAINAFEFRLRSAINHLTRKLDELDAEIHQLRRKLRWHGDEWFDDVDDDAAAWARGQSATEEGAYRYRESPQKARPQQDEETRANLKKLYRQLARRYHPDMAIDDADREYRTQMMMAINGAYAAGDLARLEELAQAPDAAQNLDYSDSNRQLAETLWREVTRVRQRLAEISLELAQLGKHESARLMKEQAEAEADGRDYFAEISEQVRGLIGQKMVIRDGLLVQVESLNLGYDDAISNDELADIVWDVSLESSFDEDIAPEFDRYIMRRRDQFYREQDFDDDFGFE